ITQERRDHDPGGEAAQAEPDIEAEQHARRRRDALAALEVVKQRKKMTQKYREPGQRRGLRRIKLGKPDREPALPRVSRQRESGHFRLVETFAERIARLLIGDFGAPWVKVSAAKLGILANARFVGVSIERGKR